jgi:hypothetical protein
MTMKLCKDCRYYVPSTDEVNMPSKSFAKCMRYRREPDPSPVTGERGIPHYCDLARTHGECTPTGIGWEPIVIEQAAA